MCHRQLCCATVLTALLVGGQGCTEPEVRKPISIGLVSGDAQQGEVGTRLPEAVVVRVVDSENHGVPFARVTFEVTTVPTEGFTPGSIESATVITDGDGTARARWTLGTEAGAQTLRALVEGASFEPATVNATAQPGAATSLAAKAGSIVAITVSDSVRVEVVGTDRYGNLATPPTITWQVSNPSVASISGAPSPDGSAMVVANAGGTTTLEARDGAAHSVRFDVRTYRGPGRDIAYESNGSIYLLSADGATSKLLGPGRDPAWSPDGRQIVFTGDVPPEGPTSLDGRAVIYVMNADGSGRRALTDPTTLRGASQPSWSPNGHKIAFVAPTEPLTPAQQSLFVMNADGSAPTLLVRAQGVCLATCASYPTWSPDGSRIAYSVFWQRSSGIRGDLFVVNADGSGDRALASSTNVEHEPAWSPDGARVAFESGAVAGAEAGPADLYAMNVDGTGRTRLTRASSLQLSDVSPSWSPERRIAFVRTTAPFLPTLPAELWVANEDGTEARRVLRVSSGVVRPAWRPGP